MTERLYYSNGHLSEFEATVVSCEKNGERYETVLDKSAFFPEGGGQLGDSGYIGEVRVFDTHERGGEVFHYSGEPLAVGERVKCKIDFDVRFRRMQNHSGEHIVSGIVHKMLGYDNVGFHMGSEDITVDYNGFVEPDMLREIEARANAAVYANLPIITEFPSPDELSSLSYRSKLELTENVRIVTVQGIDVCACCAPHVERTGEIGIIKLLDAIHYKGGIRIHLLCGYDALGDYGKRYESTKKIAAELCVKQDEAADAVLRKLDEFAEFRAKYAELKRELTERKIAELKSTEGNIAVFENDGDGDTLRRIADAGAELCTGVCAVFGKNGDAFNYCIVTRHADLKKLAKEINDAIGGRGGGSSEMIRGVASAKREVIEDYFRRKDFYHA